MTHYTSCKGKVAIVTGASSGIGEATAYELARLGVTVVLAARRKERLDAVAANIEAKGGTAFVFQVDVSKPEDVTRMVAATEDRFGRLDYAVNNAGQPAQGPFMNWAVEDFDRVWEVNLRGMFLCLQAELPSMLKTGGGSIVNMSSVAGLVGVPNQALYAATKWGIIGMTKSVALEYADRNLRINAICPGLTETEQLQGVSDEVRQFLKSITPMRRVSEPIEIARSVIYLLSAATYTTGCALAVDGAFTVG